MVQPLIVSLETDSLGIPEGVPAKVTDDTKKSLEQAMARTAVGKTSPEGVDLDRRAADEGEDEDEDEAPQEELERRALLGRLLEMGYLPARCEAVLKQAQGSGREKLGAAVEILLASSDEGNLLDSELEPEPEHVLQHQQDERTKAFATTADGFPPPTSDVQTPTKDGGERSNWERLLEMGFPPESCEAALAASPGSGRAQLDAAATLLLSNGTGPR